MSTTVKKMLKEDIELKEHLIDNYWKLLQHCEYIERRLKRIENELFKEDFKFKDANTITIKPYYKYFEQEEEK